MAESSYVALLRGINVGGNNIIKMEVLRHHFEELGFAHVSTYIQSGNVIFRDPRSRFSNQRQLEQHIETALADAIQYYGKVLVRSQREMANVVDHLPARTTDPDWKTNVLFLSSAIDAPETLRQFSPKSEIEELTWTDGVIFWSAKIAALTRTTMMKLPANPLYQEMTIRNDRTTRKIFERMSSSHIS